MIYIQLIIGCLTMLTPVVVSPELLSFDIWMMGAVSLAVVPVMCSGKRIGRIEGALFLVIYVAFIVYRFYPGISAA